MRKLVLLTLLAAAAVSADAYAQSGDPASKATPEKTSPEEKASPDKRQSLESSEEYKARVQAWLLDCTQSWDKDTHMSKKQWEESCRRAAKERVRYMMENPTLKGTK